MALVVMEQVGLNVQPNNADWVCTFVEVKCKEQGQEQEQ